MATEAEAKIEHTPGPWSVTDNSWEMSSVYGPGDELVAECPISSEVDEDTQDDFETVKEANARLIGAAPDLLDAAAKALNFIANTESELGISLSSGDALRAAIAKAGA